MLTVKVKFDTPAAYQRLLTDKTLDVEQYDRLNVITVADLEFDIRVAMHVIATKYKTTFELSH